MQDRAKPLRQPGPGLPPASIRMFFQVNGQLLQRLAAAIEAGDLPAALKAAHAIKGAGLFAGLGSVAESAQALEVSLRAQRWDEARAAMLRLKRRLRRERRGTPGRKP